MTRAESDREDLMREAVALTERIEVQCAGFEELITIGFRSHDAISLFIGQNSVYQFDPDARLRRAYVAGDLFRSQHTTLARLTRHRTEEQTVLRRHDLTDEETAAFQIAMKRVLSPLWVALAAEPADPVDCRIVRSVGDAAQIRARAARVMAIVLQRTDDWLSTQIRARK